MKHLNIIVKGKVQGVFYRKSTWKKATDLGIKGIVKNEPNGDVYIEAEGTEEQILNLVQWCYEGPPTANVDSLEITEKPTKGYTTFEIKYS